MDMPDIVRKADEASAISNVRISRETKGELFECVGRERKVKATHT